MKPHFTENWDWAFKQPCSLWSNKDSTGSMCSVDWFVDHITCYGILKEKLYLCGFLSFFFFLVRSIMLEKYKCVDLISSLQIREFMKWSRCLSPTTWRVACGFCFTVWFGATVQLRAAFQPHQPLGICKRRWLLLGLLAKIKCKRRLTSSLREGTL